MPDSSEPPRPAEITTEQSLAKGQPKRMKIATTVLEDKIREMI